jgi:hypothetical protein
LILRSSPQQAPFRSQIIDLARTGQGSYWKVSDRASRARNLDISACNTSKKKCAAARSTRLRRLHFSNRGNSRGFSALRALTLKMFKIRIQAAAEHFAIILRSVGTSHARSTPQKKDSFLIEPCASLQNRNNWQDKFLGGHLTGQRDQKIIEPGKGEPLRLFNAQTKPVAVSLCERRIALGYSAST